MAISLWHELVLVAAFQNGGLGALSTNVAEMLGLELRCVTDLVAALHLEGYLENEGAGGSIVFAPAMREALRQLNERYAKDAASLNPVAQGVLIQLAQFKHLNGEAIQS